MLMFLVSALARASEGAEAPGAAHGAEAAATIPWETLAYQTGTLVVFVGLLAYLARRPISDALRNRALAIRSQLEEAGRLKSEAQARYAEIESRLASLDARVQGMRAEAEAEAVREAERIRERAAVDAARIRDTAERTIREEGARARHELRGEAVALSIGLARETLKRSITADDQDRLAGEFLAAVDHDRTNGSGGPANG